MTKGLMAVVFSAGVAFAGPPQAPVPPQAPPVLVTAPAKPAGIAWQTDYDAAYDAAEKARKPMLILYTASKGCPACDQLARGALTDAAVVKASAGLVCVKIDTTTPTGARLAAAVGVTSVPYLCVHPAAGKSAVAELSGVRAAAEVVEALGKVSAARGSAAARPFQPVTPGIGPAGTTARTAAGIGGWWTGGPGAAGTSTNVSRATLGGFTDGCSPVG